MLTKTFAAIALLLTTTNAKTTVNEAFEGHLSGQQQLLQDDFEAIWQQFKEEMGNKASAPDANMSEQGRKEIFAQNLAKIIEHNAKEGITYKKGINPYTDMTDEEFMAHFNIKARADQDCSATQNEGLKEVTDVPDSWDWRSKNGVSPVKNQGSCGSCWTFSTVGTLEAHMLVNFGEFTPLAEQQLVDCAGDFDNHGCNGGLPSHAFEYVKFAGGISTEDAYPYYATDRPCTVDPSTFALSVGDGSFNVTEGDEDELKLAVYSQGPVSIAFEVVDGFRDYTSGVYTSDTCKNSPSDVNHAVVAVGYGTEDGVDYWIVKNSWGSDWGDEGFFKIQRGVNMCGVAECNSFPTQIKKLTSDPAFLQ